MSLPPGIHLYVGGGSRPLDLRNADDLNLVSTTDEHGDGTIEFQMCDWLDIIPPLRRPLSIFSEIGYNHNIGYIWSGYTGQSTPGGFFSGAAKILGRGWHFSASDNGWNEKKIFTAGTPSLTMVQEALSKCSHIFDTDPSLLEDLTFQLAEDSINFGLASAEDVFEYARQLTAYLTTPLMWQVRQDPNRPFVENPVLEFRATDFSPRYRVRLTKDDEFTPVYDADVIYNGAMTSYGNDQYITATNAGVVLNSPVITGSGVPDTPNTTIPFPYDTSVIPDLRIKRIRGDNQVNGLNEGEALANYLVLRNNVLRPIGFTMTLDCNTPVQAIFPAVPINTVDVPHYLIRSNYSIRVLNDFRRWGQYQQDVFYIIGTRYDWTSGKLQLTLGDPVVRDSFRLLASFDASKLGFGIKSGVINTSNKDTGVYPTYGPFVEQFPPNRIAGFSSFVTTSADPMDPFKFGGVVDPDLIEDEGLEMNFIVDVSQTGYGPSIVTIPGKYHSYDVLLSNASGPISDSCTVKIYSIPDTGVTTTLEDTIIISSASRKQADLAHDITLHRKNRIICEVTVAATSATIASFSLHAVKQYPRIPAP